MAKVQTVEGSLIQQTGAPGAGISLSPMLASGQGDVAIGQALRHTANVAGEFANRMQAVKNDAALAKAQQMMMKGNADFEEEMSRNQDETTWEEGWASRSDQLSNELMAQDLAPVVRDRLEMEVADWQAKGSVRVRGQATVRTIQREKAKFSLAAETFYGAGEAEAGDRQIALMGQHGLIAPEEVASLQKRGRAEAAMQTVNRMIDDDPIGTIDELEARTKDGHPILYKGELDADTRLALLRKAQVSAATLRSETLNDIMDGMNAGRVYEQKELDDLVDQRLLKATQAKYLMDAQKRRGTNPEFNIFAATLLQDIEDYDPSKDLTKEQQVELIGRMGNLTPIMQEFMKPILKNKVNPPAGSRDTTVIKGQIRELLSSGAFGDVSKLPSIDKYRNPTAAAQANAKYLEEMALFDDFMIKSPNATLREQKEFFEERREKYRVDPDVVIDSLTRGRRR